MIADIQAATGGTVILNAKIDPSLIGGFVLTVGDRQVDTSICKAELKVKLVKSEFVPKVRGH